MQLPCYAAPTAAGAGAILVNPWNVNDLSHAVEYALSMPERERRERHRQNYMHVTIHTAQVRGHRHRHSRAQHAPRDWLAPPAGGRAGGILGSLCLRVEKIRYVGQEWDGQLSNA